MQEISRISSHLPMIRRPIMPSQSLDGMIIRKRRPQSQERGFAKTAGEATGELMAISGFLTMINGVANIQKWAQYLFSK